MMIAAAEGKTRGCCPECRTPVRLSDDDLLGLLACNICGTEFHVERRRRARKVPRSSTAARPDDLDDIAFRRQVARNGLYWLLGFLVIVAGIVFAWVNYAALTKMV